MTAKAPLKNEAVQVKTQSNHQLKIADTLFSMNFIISITQHATH